ncbi:FAD-dependent monooxygenase [Kitasatospora sp. NPDC093679]|uniref:FAD-dependent monooxygenase n=1 Tax=Kitasatospora sp. NPDC093679 TaxID=3154983 RepID=UPI003446CFB2
MQQKAVVIGAGIGGLAAALALHLRGWQVAVHERAASLDPVGSGLGIAPNALRALDVLGAGDEVRALAGLHGEAALRRPSGRRLAAAGQEAIARAYGDPVVAVHRADLVAALHRRLPPGTVRTGSPAALADPGDARRPARVTAGGTEGEADLVVAADGLRSAARALLLPGHPGPRYSGFTTWRTVVPDPGRPVPAGETWGRGALTGVIPLTGGRVYLYAAALTPPGGRAADGDERAELLRRYGGWHRGLVDLLHSADPAAVLRHDVWELADPLPALHGGRVALLGDAAHAMTPFQGQGACQALEDAVVLAHALAGADVTGALAAYTAARLPRTTAVTAGSRRVGRLVGLRAAPAVALRDTLLAAAGRLPERTAVRAAASLLDWRPPAERTARPAAGQPR